MAWGTLEGELIKSHGWHRLTTPERAAIREGDRLGEISDRLDQLEEESEAVLENFPTAAATSVDGVLANLTIAMTLLYPEDHERVHGLIMRAIADIKRLAA